MKVVIWDWHADEFYRINHYVKGDRYIGETPPNNYDLLIAPDGPWLNLIRDKSKVIVYPCVKDVDHIKALGYTRAYTKDKEQTYKWGEGAICLPPLMNAEPKGYNKDLLVSSIVHNFEERDAKGYAMTKAWGVKNYGFPDNPTWEAESIIEMSRFILHAKHVGYLCNVVIKAISLGTPCIFTPESFTFGYKDYLTPDINCFIVSNKQQLDSVLNMSDYRYNEVLNNLKLAKEEIIRKGGSNYGEIHTSDKDI
jgi:hypothetical protein